MVVRRTIENLRERPKDEKTAIAASIAIGVVLILLLAWLVFFFHSIESARSQSQQAATSTSSENGLQEAEQQFQAYGSTTQFVQSSSGTIELQSVGSTTEPQ